MARRVIKKKEEIAKGSPESLMNILKAGAMFVLVVLGIIGVAVSVFSEGGWLGIFFDKLTNLDTDLLVIVPLVLIVLYVVKVWFEKTTGKSSAEVMGNMALFIMMAFGLFFLYRLLTLGSFTG
jgi:membrane protein insertase Oxa1/YidC/SpoIIIJ